MYNSKLLDDVEMNKVYGVDYVGVLENVDPNASSDAKR